MFVVKMDNGRGFVEWYSGLSVRVQAERKESARKFSSREVAQKAADFCVQCPDAFCGAYLDNASGRYTMKSTVEPL
mgnify:CR=1 FL=1